MDISRFKNIVDCAGVALISNGRIFLVRPYFDFKPQNYGIPKGHIEKGERAEDAAAREFAEETGISVDKSKLQLLTTVYTKINSDTAKRVFVYKAIGNGEEHFNGSNIRPETGTPENISGEYIGLEIAKKLITSYQTPIIDKLIEDESSFSGFCESRLIQF